MARLAPRALVAGMLLLSLASLFVVCGGSIALAPLAMAPLAKLGASKALRSEMRVDGDSVCPGSPVMIHAKCKLAVHFEQPCAKVQQVMESRMNAVHDCKARPGTYRGTWQAGSRTTGDERYTDKFKIMLAPAHSGGCTMSACSESQVFSVLDYSTNYCNLFNLYGNASSPLTFAEHLDSCGQHDKDKCCR
jgi:hypothetical protein